MFHVPIFLRFLIYNLLKFQNLKKLYRLINKKIAADHIKNVISKSKNNIDSNINFNDINNKIIKLHFKLHYINNIIQLSLHISYLFMYYVHKIIIYNTCYILQYTY